MVELEREGGVARIFLNRPQKVNALDSALLDALVASLSALAGDDSLRVVVLAGRGKAFCGGAGGPEPAAPHARRARRVITPTPPARRPGRPPPGPGVAAG